MQTPIEGDDVFDELFRFTEHLVRRFRFYESAVADAVVMAIQYKFLDESGFKGLDNWKGWLFQTARRRSMNIARRDAGSDHSLTIPSSRLPMSWNTAKRPTPSKPLSAIFLRVCEVFVFCIIDQHSRSDAAAMFGLPIGTVHGRLATAYRRVREQLRSGGFDIPAPKKVKYKCAWRPDVLLYVSKFDIKTNIEISCGIASQFIELPDGKPVLSVHLKETAMPVKRYEKVDKHRLKFRDQARKIRP